MVQSIYLEILNFGTYKYQQCTANVFHTITNLTSESLVTSYTLHTILKAVIFIFLLKILLVQLQLFQSKARLKAISSSDLLLLKKIQPNTSTPTVLTALDCCRQLWKKHIMKTNSVLWQLTLMCRIFGFCLLSFPQK